MTIAKDFPTLHSSSCSTLSLSSWLIMKPCNRSNPIWFIASRVLLFYPNLWIEIGMMQIEWNTQNCKLFTSTRLIWWWKFPFSAIAKASNSPRFWNRETSKKGWKESFSLAIESFSSSRCWFPLFASMNYFAGIPRRVYHRKSNQHQTKGLCVVGLTTCVW